MINPTSKSPSPKESGICRRTRLRHCRKVSKISRQHSQNSIDQTKYSKNLKRAIWIVIGLYALANVTYGSKKALTPLTLQFTHHGGASPSDVDQGQLPDCSILASTAAIAKTCPSLINRLIQEQKPGSYTVLWLLLKNRALIPENSPELFQASFHIPVVTCSRKNLSNNNVITEHHAHAVIGISQNQEERLILLYDPHGHHIEIPFANYMQSFVACNDEPFENLRPELDRATTNAHLLASLDTDLLNGNILNTQEFIERLPQIIQYCKSKL